MSDFEVINGSIFKNETCENCKQLKKQLEEKDKELIKMQNKLISAEKLINIYKDKLNKELFGEKNE